MNELRVTIIGDGKLISPGNLTVSESAFSIGITKRRLQKLCQKHQERFNLQKHGHSWIVNREFFEFLLKRKRNGKVT